MPFLNSNRKLTHVLLPLIVLVAGLYLVPLTIFEVSFSKVPGDYGDSRFNNYILEHGYKYITGQTGRYWDAPFMYPYRNVIAFSDNLLGTVPLYTAFRVLGQDRETSYQLWLLVLFILNFACCYWVLNKWLKSPILAVTGAYIFAFSIFNLGHFSNIQVFPRFIVPCVFYWSWLYLSQKKPVYFLYTLLGIVFQFYCAIYLGFLLVYTLLFLFIAYCLVYRDTTLFTSFKSLKNIGLHLGAILLALLLLVPLMEPYLEMSQQLGPRKFEDIVNSIPTLRSYFFTTKAAVVWGILARQGIPLPNWWLHILYMGAMPWLGIAALPLVLFSKKTKPETKKFLFFLFLALFLSFIFCLNINGFCLYRLIFQIPGFSSMRSMNRLINTEVMFFILIFVFVFNELSKRGRTLKWIVMCFPLLVIVDNLIDAREVIRYDKQESRRQVTELRKEIEVSTGNKYSAIAYMPEEIIGNEITLHVNAMLASQELNIPCVNGYSGYTPGGKFNDFFFNPDGERLRIWCEHNRIDKNLVKQIYTQSILDKKQISLRAFTGKFVCGDQAAGNILVANRKIAAGWEIFTLILLENNRCMLRSSDAQYWELKPGQQEITSTGTRMGAEAFTLVTLDSNCVAFKTSSGRYITIDPVSQKLMTGGTLSDPGVKFTMPVK